MTTMRRCLAVGLLWLGFVAWAASPASAQVAGQADGRYAGPGLAVPTINASGPAGGVLGASGPAGGVLGSAGGVVGSVPAGGVLAASGQRTPVAVNEAVPTQVLASQVSGGVAGTTQAPVQGLAFTGADIATLVTFGIVAIMVGVVLNRRARPRSLADQ